MSSLDLLLNQLDQAYEKKSWHGPNLRGSLRGVTVTTAVWRPGPERHNIWEIAVHCAYWKYAVRRRLLGEKRGSFSIKGSNWFPRPEPRPEVDADQSGDWRQGLWEQELWLLGEMQRRLREAVSALEPEALTITPRGSKVSNLDLIQGVAAHDVYHAGQIQLLKRLAGAEDE